MKESTVSTTVYAGRIKDRELLKRSSSGGAFTAISDFFLSNGNAVVCAVYNCKSHKAEFCLITEQESRNKALGSKYMQSNLGDIFSESLIWLNNNPDKSLLFVGMGCQADGFRKYAEIMHIGDRVTIVDIICHGSPSPKIWSEYAKSIEDKHNGMISYISFKDKRNGWYNPTALALINGKEYSIKKYVNIFYGKCAMRPSCHKCPYCSAERKTDITIGDFWGIEKVMPHFYDSLGNSVFLLHTERGRILFEKIKGNLDFLISNKEDCYQPNLEHPTEASVKRNDFWLNYQTRGIEFIMKEYGTNSLPIRIVNKLKRIFGGGVIYQIYGISFFCVREIYMSAFLHRRAI